jgi:hypothetical protein
MSMRGVMRKAALLGAALAAMAGLSMRFLAAGPALTFVYTEARDYDASSWMEGKDRYPRGAALWLVSGGERRPVAPGFASSADAAVSFDGKRILFSGKRAAGERWQIWETAVEGGASKRIATREADCVRPAYLPDDRIVYTLLAPGRSDLEAAPLAGGTPLRLTYAPGRYLLDQVLSDGRILFEAVRSYTGKPVRELFTVYPNGTGVESVRCDHGGDRSGAFQLASGDIVFAAAGRLARFTSALAAQTEIAQPAKIIQGPAAELLDGSWLISARGTQHGKYRIYRWSPAEKRLPAVLTPSGRHAIQPVVVAPRTPPRRFPSALLPSRTAGNLRCLNARLSREPMPDRPVGSVSAYTQDAAGRPLLLGRSAVESDGSFFLQLPADKPLRIEIHDDRGGTLRSEQGWFWMRPSEQRICVGCHAGPERTPENHVPRVLLRKDVPVKMLAPAMAYVSR